HRLDELVQRFEAHPDPAVQACAFELLQCVDAVHRAAMGRLAGLLAEAGLAERALADPAVALLFELYGLAGDRPPAHAGHRPPPAPPPGFVRLSSISLRRGSVSSRER